MAAGQPGRRSGPGPRLLRELRGRLDDRHRRRQSNRADRQDQARLRALQDRHRRAAGPRLRGELPGQHGGGGGPGRQEGRGHHPGGARPGRHGPGRRGRPHLRRQPGHGPRQRHRPRESGREWARVPVGKAPGDLAVDPTTGTVYVSDAGTSTVSVFQDRLDGQPAELPRTGGIPWSESPCRPSACRTWWTAGSGPRRSGRARSTS